ncbi:MAG: hypothetical protein OHK0057_04340 [Thermoflexibacter sp.]
MNNLQVTSNSERIELKNEGGYVYLMIEADKENNWLYYKWRGFLLMEELKKGYNKILEVLESQKLQRALADHANIVGPWNEANEWLVNEWTPKANKLGLKYLAINTAGDLFSNISLELFLINNKNSYYTTQVFDTLEEAKSWLRKVS